MALVFRSDRKTIFDIKKKRFDTGPGQYLPLDIRSKIELNKVPFSSSSKKESDKERKEGNPGPGFYQKDDDMENFFNSLDRNKVKKKVGPIYKSLDIDQITSLEPLGFMSKLKRFEEKNADEIPGPGCYNINEFKFKNFSRSPIEVNTKIEKKILYQPNKLVSIPAKHQSFGYQLKEEGRVEIAEDPLKNFRHKGEGVDSVGPGEYDIFLQWKNKNKGTEWSKYKSQKCYNYNPKKSNEDLLNSNKKHINTTDLLRKSENYEKNKNDKERFFKQLRGRIEKRHQLVDEKNKSLTTSDFDKLKKIMSSPGPGYYELNSSFDKANVPPKQFQYFGSIVERFHESKDDRLGPGKYFRDDTFVKKSPKVKKHYAPFNSKTIRNVSAACLADVPGPGYYDYKAPIGKKSYSKHAIFESSEARFSEMEKTSGPGPGQYSAAESNDYIKRYKYTAAFKGSPRMKPLEPNTEEVAYPSVGQYNTDIVTSISYSVDKKVLRPSMVNAPFNSMKNRWDKVKRPEFNIGPGQYFHENKLMKEQKSPPFKVGEKRFKNSDQQSLGPGEYEKENYFDWNKKSYNILYL